MCGMLSGLNAPSGAQCFPTWEREICGDMPCLSQCTFWCSVLSDNAKDKDWRNKVKVTSQCTFWCSVLSDLSL